MHMARKADQFAWTLDELDRLPDDGNKYELVRGELFVTPAPSPAHERIAAVLSELLTHYVHARGIGRVFHPRSVVRAQGSEVEPDIMVREWTAAIPAKWEDAPLPLLVVEISSGVTGRRDRGPKRDFYVDLGIPDYWIVDGRARTIRVIRSPGFDADLSDFLTWQPAGAAEPFRLDIAAMFAEAFGT